MATIDVNLISIIAFYSLIAVFLYVKRKKIETQMKIIFLYKTETFNKIMLKIANCCPRFWRGFGLAAIPIGILGMFFIVGYLIYALVKLFAVPTAVASLSVVVPGVKIPGSPFIPFWYGIIALFIVIIVHEGAHGIVLAANKLKIKSSGFGLALFLPLAFVEPDEEQLMKQKPKVQMSVYAAGAFSNFVTAALVLLLTIGLTPVAASVIGASGVYIESVTADMPAAVAGLQPGDIITKVDGLNTASTTEFENYMLSILPGKVVDIKTKDRDFVIKTQANPSNASRAYLGIEFRQNIDVKPDLKAKFGKAPMILFYLVNLFYWVFALNVGIGVINLLPLGPIDGGRIARSLIESLLKKKVSMKIFTVLTYISLFLLLANIIIPYIKMAIA